MANSKKVKKVENVNKVEPIEPISTVIEQKRIENCEWCFQFDEDEPQVFAWTDDQLKYEEEPKVVFTISNIENSYITFKNEESGKNFKIFARELSEKGKELRDRQREILNNIQDQENNFEKL
jgi:hypothetical protein